MVNNATANEQGSRIYEFQVADNENFNLVAGRTATVAFAQSGIPEGSNGKTSLPLPADLLPTTTYHWRARAIQGAAIGPWSSTARFRTKLQSFRSGNRVFDQLTDGETLEDMISAISFFEAGDPDPGAKLDGDESFLGYRITTLAEGAIVLPWRCWTVNSSRNRRPAPEGAKTSNSRFAWVPRFARSTRNSTRPMRTGGESRRWVSAQAV